LAKDDIIIRDITDKFQSTWYPYNIAHLVLKFVNLLIPNIILFVVPVKC
jgi:hypothetical protein